MTGTLTPYRSARQGGRDGFARLLHAEWTKFRTVRAWVIALAAVPAMMLLFALLAGAGGGHRGTPSVALGPGGEPVTDSFYFVHRQLAGDGSITVSVSALEERLPRGRQPVTVPWAKAGLILKADPRPGSPYAAIMVTASHGVRMQDDYVHDAPGLPGAVSGASVRWLRLERVGDTITGYDCADGTHWTEVGAVHVDGLGPSVQGGLFVASPDSVQGFGADSSVSTAVFGHLTAQGGWPAGQWSGGQVAAQASADARPAFSPGAFTQSGGTFTVTGTGDIAPAVRASLPGAGVIADILFGTFPALITVIVVATLFATCEYRDELIRITLAASPGRARVLAAKALIAGAVTFAAALAGTLVAVPIGERLARANGVYLFPVTTGAELRVEFGTAALLATAAVLALGLGTALRRSAAAVTTATLAIVLPYLLVAQIPFLPAGAADWLTRLTPAAAFTLQHTLVRYPQVASLYTPYNGYYPLAAWAGYAVFAGYALASLAVAAVLLRRRDA